MISIPCLKRSLILLTFFLILVLTACTTTGPTKPNVPFAGNPYPTILNNVAQNNPLLAEEIGKLPELQDGISKEEVITLKKLTMLYNSESESFDRAFEKMYQVGLSEVRKYCSPLQAFFWLIQKDTEHAKQYIESSNIEEAIISAWDYGDETKWENPEQVLDRLNSPELFELWFRFNFTYNWDKLPITNPYTSLQSVKESIKKKTGVCTDAAYLACNCLKSAGYETIALRSYFFSTSSRHPLGGFVGHTVCIVKKDGALYITGDTNLLETTDRPFKTFKEITEYMARCHGVPLSGYIMGVDAFYRLRQ